MKDLRVVVIGNGMVGHHFVEQLAQHEGFEITVIGGEPRPAYDRVHLSDVFAGKEPADLALANRAWYQAQGVASSFGDPVVKIDAFGIVFPDAFRKNA